MGKTVIFMSKFELDVEKVFPVTGESRTKGNSLSIKGCTFRTEMKRNFLREVGESVVFKVTDGSGGSHWVF